MTASGSRVPDPLAGGGGADTGSAWGAMPRRSRLAFLGKWRNPIGLFGAGIIVVNVLVAVLGSLVWRKGPDEQDADRLLPPSWANPLGTRPL